MNATTVSTFLPILNHYASSSAWPWWRVLLTLSAVLAISLFLKFMNASSVRLPPGPRGLPLLGSLPFLDPQLHTHFAELGRAYGPITKIWLGNKLGIIVSSPAAASQILKVHDATFANRDVPAAGRAATYGGHDIVWAPHGAEWRMLRKVCTANLLSNATLDTMYGLRRAELRKAVGYLYGRVGSPVNIGEQVLLTILNVMTSMMWGGTVEGEERESLGAEFRRAVSEMTDMLGTPNLSDFYPSLARFDLQGVTRRVGVVAGKFDKIFQTVIDQRRKMDGADPSKVDEGRNDFLQCLLKLVDEGAAAKTPLTMTNLKALFMDMVVGASDSSSNTLEFAIGEIVNKPQVMRKVQRELDEVVGRDNIVEESHTHKLPYLLAVLKETLRLHPPVPLLVPRTPTKTCIVSGYTIPEGSSIFVNVWAIHRDPLIWEDPTEFVPERFLDGKHDFSGNDFTYLPFGSGRRICVGSAMAERTALYTLATLLHSFDWRVGNGEKVDLSEKYGIVLKLRKPLVAVPTPRLSDPALYR